MPASRIRLSKSVVDEAVPSGSSEEWLSDTEVRGFGLRLWRNPSGSVGKAFGFRKYVGGRSVRKTFDPWPAYVQFSRRWSLRHFLTEDSNFADPSLGDLTQDARAWAQDTHDELIGRKLFGGVRGERMFVSLSEEDKQQKAALAQAVRSKSFGELKDANLLRLRIDGASEKYLDRLDKIFELHVPASVKASACTDVSFEAVKQIIGQLPNPSAARQLRSLFGQMSTMSSSLGCRLGYLGFQMREVPTPHVDGEQLFKDRPNLMFEIYEYLRDVSDLVTQSLALQLYLSTYTTMQRVLAARWSDIHVVTYEPTTFIPNSRTLIEWHCGDGWRNSVRVGRVELDVLIGARNLPNFGGEYLFPSNSSRNPNGPIRSCQTLWKRCSQSLHLADHSPRSLRQAYLEFGSYMAHPKRTDHFEDRHIEYTEEIAAALSKSGTL